MAKLDRFDDEQWAQVYAHRDRWLAVGLSTEPADRDRAETAIVEMYRIVGEAAPRFVWCESPATCLLVLAVLGDGDGRGSLVGSLAGSLVGSLVGSLEGSLEGSLWDSLRGSLVGSLWDSLEGSLTGSLASSLVGSLTDSLWDSLWGSLGDSLEGSLVGSLEGSLTGSLADSLWDSVAGSLVGSLASSLVGSLWGSLRDSLGDPVRDSLGDPVRDSLGDPVRGSLEGSLRDSLTGSLADSRFWGQHDAWWVGYYTTIRDCGHVTYQPQDSHRLDLWADIAQSAGWWWPYRGLVVISGRPSTVAVEPAGDHGRVWLHNPTGPALSYPDGWRVHAWHGTRVPEWVIIDPTVQRILAERNVEIRRCAVESMGWDRYIADAGLRLHSAADDPGNPGQRLELYDAPGDLLGAPIRVLLCTNGTAERDGTRRRYGLTVPADMPDPVTAGAWTYDLDRDTYASMTRRT